MRRRWLIGSVMGMMVVSLSGCATRERYEAEIQTFQGQPIAAVMERYGYPSGSFEAPNGNTVYVYDRQAAYFSPPVVTTSVFGGRHGVGFGTGIGFGLGGGRLNELRCQTFFEVDKSPEKRVLTWRLQGNDCRR